MLIGEKRLRGPDEGFEIMTIGILAFSFSVLPHILDLRIVSYYI